MAFNYNNDISSNSNDNNNNNILSYKKINDELVI